MLSGSLTLVNRLLSRPEAAFAFGAGTDPLQINLPPLGAAPQQPRNFGWRFFWSV